MIGRGSYGYVVKAQNVINNQLVHHILFRLLLKKYLICSMILLILEEFSDKL